MADTSATRLSRLLALVPWLLANGGVSMQEAAAHFQITPEQLEKDLFLLIVSGLPGYGPDQLVDIQFWDDGRIHVLDPQTLDQPLRLSGEEATALLVALRLLAQVPGDHDRAALQRAASQLEEALGDAAHVEVRVVADRQVLDAVTTALAEHGALRIVYGAATADALTERIVIPRSVRSLDGVTTLEAYCTHARAIRTFRVDRIHRAETVDHPGIPDSAPSDVSPSVPVTAQVRVDAEWAAELLGMRDSSVREDGWLAGSVDVWDPEWLIRSVLGLGGAAEVLAPPDLRQAVADAADRAIAAYA